MRSETLSVPFLDTWFTVLTWITASFFLLWLPVHYQHCVCDICLFSSPLCHALLDNGMKTCLYLSRDLGSPPEILVVQTTRLNQALWKVNDWCNLHWSRSSAWFWSVSSGFDWEVLMWPRKPLVSKPIKLRFFFNCAVVTDIQFLCWNQKACEALSGTWSTSSSRMCFACEK